MSFTIFEAPDGTTFRCTTAQAETLKSLTEIVKGGIGTVHGYVATSGRTKPEKADIQFITAFSIEKLYQRRLAALEGISFDDVRDHANRQEKIKALNEDAQIEIFNARREMEMASLRKTLDGDRSDARRQAHDRVYCRIGPGVKVHYRTTKNDDGIKVPEIVAGLPVAENILLDILEIDRKVVEPGEYKKVNSGAPVLMSNAIKKALNMKSLNMKTLSLKEDNFDSLVVSRKSFLPEDVKEIPADLFLRG